MQSNVGLTHLRSVATNKSLAMDTLAFAKVMDEEDPLSKYRSEFHFPFYEKDGTQVPYRYFCGNSLGLQHRDVEAAVCAETKKWREQGVEGHFRQPNPWFEIDDILREDMAKIVGALPSEVAVMSSLTVNLHLLLSAFYRPEGKKVKILCEANPFPSDTHALVSQLENHGFSADENLIVVTAGKDDNDIIATEKFIEAIEKNHDSLALVLVAGVHFLTGQFFDVKAIAAAAHKHNIPCGVDFAHAAGNLPLQLHDWDIDFACWCTYKYLNGGPGNIGGLFVHEKHTAAAAETADTAGEPGEQGHQPRVLKGWWGHQRSNRFHLGTDFYPAVGAARFQLSNPCVLSIMSLAPSVRLCASIGMQTLREKSLKLTGYLELLIQERLSHALQIVSPGDENQRGAQLSVRIRPKRVKSKATGAIYACGTDVPSDALVVQNQLLDLGIICDNRPPDFLRLSPVPTYNSFEDVFVLVETLKTLFITADEAAAMDKA